MKEADVSAHFHAYCNHARKIGPRGYEQVGKVLIWHTVEEECSTTGLIELLALLDSKDDLAVLTWLRQHYPEHLKLIPPKQYARFLAGVYWCAERLELHVLPKRLEAEADDIPTFSPRALLVRLRPSLN